MSGGVRREAKSAAALACARGDAPSKISEDLGVAPRTLLRWRKDPDFQAEIGRHRGEMLDRAAGVLSGAAERAVFALCEMLDSGNDAIRIRAAKEILASTLTVRDSVEFEARLCRLEEHGAGHDAP